MNPERFGGNAFSSWTALAFIAIVSFFLSPYIVHHLGSKAYGVWSLLVAMVGYLGLLDFGVRGVVTRYVASHHAAADTEDCSSVVSAGLRLYGFIGLLAAVVAGLFAWLSPLIFNIPPQLVDDSRIALELGGLTVASTLVGAVFAGVVTGLERFDISNGVDITMTSVRTAAVVVALEAGYGLVALALIHLAVSVLQGTLAWANVKRLYPALRLTFREKVKPHARTIVSLGALLGLIQVFGLLIYFSNALVAAAFLPIAAVTYFAIAGNLVEIAGRVAGALWRVMMPREVPLEADGAGSGAAVLAASRVATLATAPIALTFLLRGEALVDLWMGGDYGSVAGGILEILSPLLLLAGARGIAVSSIIGMNRHRLLLPWLAFEAIASIAISLALVKSLGLWGVAIGAVIPSVVVGAFIPVILFKACGIPVREFIRNAWAKPVLACLPFAFGTALVEHYLPAETLGTFFLQAGLLSALVAPGAWLCLTADERRYVAAAARRLPGPRLALSRGVRAAYGPVEEYMMVVLFYFVVRPLARSLPLESSKNVYAVLAWAVSNTTFRARDMASNYAVAFGMDAAAAKAMARRKVYWLIWEYATQVHGLKDPDWYKQYACEQVNREAVEKVLASGSSFILAMGHFVRDHSVVWSLSRSTLPLDVTHLIGPIPPLDLSRPQQIYNRIHLNAMKDLMGVLHGGDLGIALVGDESASAARLIRNLKASRMALSIMVDAPWNASQHRSALVRDFAGKARAPFAVGAARMARAAACPILLCIQEYVDESRCRLVWHDPVWVPKDAGHEADVAATNILLDAIERAIGRQPDRYVMPIGEERCWNAASGCWEDAKPASRETRA